MAKYECLPCSFLNWTSSYPRKVSGKKELVYYPAFLLVSCFFSGYLLCCAQVTYFVFIALDNVLYMYMQLKVKNKQNIVVKNR